MKRPPVIIVQLVHILGPLKGEIQEFSEPVISIGRNPGSHLRFPADLTTVSRKHAEIVREGNQFKLTDHSVNGTLVNGKQVKEAFLKDGDVLEFSKGGPKVSFLTQIREGKEEKEQPVSSPRPREAAQTEVRKLEPERPEVIQPEPVRPRVEPAEERVFVQPVRVPLIIQYGPTLRSYKQLPVTIGKNPKCDFKLDHPSILDQHAQVFFAQNQYWVKDLTGSRAVQINGQPIGLQAPLKADDELALTPKGPVFRFLGEGRLAEIVSPSPVEPPGPPGKKKEPPQRSGSEARTPEGLFSKVKKIFES